MFCDMMAANGLTTPSPAEAMANTVSPRLRRRISPRNGVGGGGGGGGGGGATPDRRFRHRTEFVRERDVLRHLQAWEETHRPPSLHRNVFPDDQPFSHTPEPCPDPALAAFAQLCALRLHARRCLVTLLSTSTEYVLADVTGSMSLQYDTADEVGDEAWLGTCCFPRIQGLNGTALDDWRKAKRVREEPQEMDHYYTEGITQHWNVISDLRQHQSLRQAFRFVSRGSWIRFLASVPLRGAQGSVIGSLTILDDKPRYGVSARELGLMEDLSDTVVEHLDATVVRMQQQQSQRLMLGLGLFNNGKDSLREWWSLQDDSRILSTGRHADKGGAGDRQARQDVEFGVQEQMHDQTPRFTDNPNTLIRGFFDLEQEPKMLQQDTVISSGKPLPRRNQPPKQRGDPTFDLAEAVEDMLSRASNILRECLGADGVVLVNTSASLRRSTAEKLESKSGSGLSSAPSSDAEVSSDADASPELMCEVQSFSTRTHASANGFTPDSQPFNMSEVELRRLVKRYPKGRVFEYDQNGHSHWSSEEESSSGLSGREDDAKRERRRRTRDGDILSAVIKDARQIAIYPLWDESNERWRSCIFAWRTKHATYYDKRDDLTFLSTFGHSVIAELAHLESKAADYAKGTFITSMSHELRSPLHGIMAGVEFLLESELSNFQRDMAKTISMAGKTLLDTINHILDHSKISQFSRSRAGKGPSRSKSDLRPWHPATPAANSSEFGARHIVDLARLTEEVVDTTVIGHKSSYQMPLSPLGSGTDQPSPVSTTQPSREVSVILDIAPRFNWVVELKSGGWTRIVQNLVANALKYTAEGLVSVKLEAEQPPSDDASATCPVVLTVEDSGIGISAAFQSHGMFTPFKQENPHSIGTGLGLSIVKSITKEMGAKLTLTSERGKGTTVVVRFNARFLPASEATDPPDEAWTRLRGLDIDRLHIFTPGNADSDRSPTLSPVANSVLQNAKEWLDCKVSAGPRLPEHDGRCVYAIAEEDLTASASKDENLVLGLLAQASAHHAPVLVLGSSLSSALSLESWLTRHAIDTAFINQPIGPRKLLRLILEGPRESIMSYPNTGLSVRNGTDGSSAVPSERPIRPRLTQSAGSSRRMTDGPGSTPSSTDDSMQSDASKDKVLLVEDNEVNMRLLVALMKKLGLPHCCASNGHEAVVIYRQEHKSIMLVLMDISMPVMDGCTATAKIRECEKKEGLTRTTIAALTGVTNPEAKAKAFDCGVDEYYSKPVKMNDLKQLVGRIQRE